MLRGLLIALAIGRPLGAQGTRRTVVEIGATAVRFPVDEVTVVGPSARLAALLESDRLYASASAAGVLSSGVASGATELRGGGRSTLGAAWVGELDGEMASVHGTATREARTGVVSARLLRPGEDGGAWLRASGNVSSREAGLLWGRGVGVGGWRSMGRATLTGSLTREWASAQLFAGGGRADVVGTVPARYTEASLGLRIDADAASIEVGGVVRRDPDAEHLLEPGMHANAAWWVRPEVAVTLSAARQLPDFVRGADEVRLVALGLRFNDPSPRAALVAAMRPTVHLREDEGGTTLRVRAPGARRVEVMADFTDWEPIELRRDGDAFSRSVVLPAGTHHVVVRVDGGAWAPAANTPAVDDDLGGRVGLLVVPEGATGR